MGIDWFLFHGVRIRKVLNPRHTKRESHFGDIGFGSSAVDARGYRIAAETAATTADETRESFR
jgi:hypothetical protein